MTEAVYLRSVSLAGPGGDLAAAVDGVLSDGVVPDALYLVSGCEDHILAVGAGAAHLHRLAAAFPFAGTRLVHLGCLGFFGAVADFQLSGRACAVVICDESAEQLGQRCLAVAGVGIGSAGGGMRAVSGQGLVVLVRTDQPLAGDLQIGDVRIYAQGGGIDGTLRLLTAMRRAFASFREMGVEVVSFGIDTPWSHALMRELHPRAGQPAWLPSAEHDRNHLMSLKPLREVELYGAQMAAGSVAVITLGLGGRIGIMRLGRTPVFPLLVDAHALLPNVLPPITVPPAGTGHMPAGRVREMAALDPAHLAKDGFYFVADLMTGPMLTALPISAMADESMAAAIIITGEFDACAGS